MAGRLDRYVTKTVVGAFAAGLVFLILLSIVIDILVRLGTYLQAAQNRDVGTLELLADMARFYTVSVPFLFVTIAPFVTVIAGMFAVSRLLGANEVVPMLFTGRSLFRVLRPMLFCAALSGAAMAACWEFVIPGLTPAHESLRRRLEGGGGAQIEHLVVKQRGEVNQTLFCDAYDHDRQRMTGVAMVDQGSSLADEVVVQAAAAVFDPAASDWALADGQRRSPRGFTGVRWLGMAGLTPDLLWRTGKEAREAAGLSYSELLDLRELRPGRRDFVLAFHAHLTFPLANLILLMLALPFAVQFERSSRAERVVFAVAVCAAYLIADLTCQTLGRTGDLHPVFAAWLPTILFGSLGVVFFGSVRT